MTIPPVAASDPRNWLLSQPQLIFLLFVGAVWLFKLIARARTSVSDAARGPQPAQPEPGGQAGSAAADTDDEYRSRRVREEILRKIAERRAGAAGPQPARIRVERLATEPPAIVRAAPTASRGPAEAAAPGFPGAQAPPSPGGRPDVSAAGGAAGPSAGALWLDDLRTRDTVRRAILVREILGPPVSLR
ncbi:MAG TPA: hypothetical protein VN775_04565 [Opitutaceae bacterium]|nr:hypothetical protein [Opitutaceae bacterium]